MESNITKQSLIKGLSNELWGLLRCDNAGKLLFGNKAACEYFGIKEFEIPGKSYADLLEKISNKKWDIDFTNLPITIDVHHENIGKTFKHQIEAFQSGAIIMVYAEEHLTRIETDMVKDFELIVETIDFGIVYQERDGIITYANAAAQKILGLSFEQLTGRDSLHPEWKSIHPDGSDFPGNEHPAMVSLATGKPVRNEVMGVYHPELAAYVWILINSYPVFNSNTNEIQGVFASFKDITSQFASQKELSYQIEMGQILVEATTKFVNLDLSLLDDEINLLLARLGRFLEVDRFYIFKYDFEKDLGSNTHEWCAEGIEPQIQNLQDFPVSYVSDWTDLNKQGKPFFVRDVSKLPDEDNMKKVLADQDIKSMYCMPIMVKEACVGMVGFDAVKNLYEFKESQINLLRVIAELMASIEERKRNTILINEALKELNGVYEVSQLNAELKLHISAFLKKTCEIVRHAFHFPDQTYVVIHYLEQQYTTEIFSKTDNVLTKKLIVDDVLELGEIAVYIDNSVDFLESETEFLNTVARLIIQKYNKDVFEETLQASEEKFRIIADNNYNWEFWEAPDGTFIYHSPSCVNVTEYTAEEMQSNPQIIQQLIHPKDQEAYHQFKEQTSGLKAAGKHNFRINTKSGQLKFIEQVCQPVYAQNGKYLGIRGTNVDVSEKVLAYAELSKSEQRLNNLLNSQTSYVLRTDLRGRHTYWNKAFEDAFGWLYEEKGLSEQDSLASICEYDRPKAQETVFKCFKAPGKIFKVQLEKPARDGSTLVTQWDFVCITDDKGHPFEIQCIGIDITDSVRSFNKLQESERWLESLLKSQTSFVLRTNMEGKHTYWNHAFENTFGWIYETGLDHQDSLKSICEYHHPRTLEAVTACIAEPGKIVKVELDKPAKNNEIRTTLWEFVCLTNSKGEPEEIQCMGIDITERRQAEKKMLESEEKYRLLFNVSPDPILIYDVNGNILEFNEATCRLLDISKNMIAGNKILSFSTPLQKDHLPAAKLFKKYNRICIEDGFVNYEWQLTNSRKETVYIIVSCVSVDYNNQKAIYASWKDITAMKKAQEEVFRFKTVIDQATYGSAINDLDGKFIYVNNAFANMHGYEPEELMDKDLTIFHNEAQLPEVMRLVNDIKEKGGFVNEEVPHVHKDGTEFPTLMSAKLIVDENNIPQFLSATCIDISDKVERETVIKNQNRQLNAIIGALPDMIFLNDIDGNYLDFYRSNVTNESRDFSFLVGKNIREVFEKDNAEKHLYNIQKCIETGSMVSYDYPLNENGQELYYEARIVKMDERSVLRFVRNITERKRTEQIIIDLNQNLELKVQERTNELKLANEALEKAKEEADTANEAKSVFLSRMSHELRTPMNAILGFAQILEMTALDDKQKKGVSHILKSGNHLLNLINEVLDIARIESGNISLSVEHVPLNSVVSEVMDLFLPVAAARDIEISFKPSGNLSVMADRQRLKQILINVVNNAVKYNHVGGKVWIETALNKEFVRISVSDNGFGINKENLSKLFTPFERIGAEKHNIEGTGLGLSVVKQLTHAMNGRLGVESEVRKGSTFWFEFIGSKENTEALDFDELIARANDEGNNNSQNIIQKEKTVLYVEDNYSNIELIETIFKNAHPDVNLVALTYGGNAVNLAKLYKPELILLDLHLPDIHGSEVFDKLRLDPETRDIPVVILSADGMQKQIEYMLNLGAKAYLIKPIKVNEFLNIVEVYLK